MKPSLLLACLALVPAQDKDAAKNLKAKEFEIRLAAVDLLSRDADPRAERLLHTALKDEDWEVVERAARGLAEHGSPVSVDPLVKLALDGPVRRIRRAAADTLAKVAAVPAAESLIRKTSGADAVRACEALELVLRGALLAPGAPAGGVELKALRRVAEKDKDASTRAAASRALLAGSGADRPEVLGRVLEDASVEVACAAVDLVALEPRADCDAALLGLLARPALHDGVERRAIRALAASFRARDEDEAARKSALASLEPLLSAKSGAVSARGARLLARIAPEEAADESHRGGASEAPATNAGPEAPPAGGAQPAGGPDPAPGFDRAALCAALGPALSHADALARAAAAKALARIGGEEAAKIALSLGANDKDERVRFQAVVAVSILRGGEEDALAFLAGRLASDLDPEVRAQAAVALGRKGAESAVEPLSKALADKDWGVAACAAVSLGKTQSGAAIGPLSELSRKSDDWKLRGAAVAGLAQMYVKSAIPAVIPAVEDADPCVARTAQVWLSAVSREEIPPKVAAWNDWWAKASGRVLLADPEEQKALRQRLGDSGTAPPEVWRGQDLVVLESRGDHIQKILEKQKVEHRLTTAGKIGETALHPTALFVANCTGEIEEKDVDRLRWFVLCGGHLFGSCWALHETIERALPGVLRKFETSSEVMDSVPAADISGQSPHTEGVFGDGVRPMYALIGAHLIEVLDPERAVVLVDSPPCADAWGSGNLAAWFTAGHGTVLDSVNHFEAQGLELAQGLKSRKDRMAYAVDHMGLQYAELRARHGERYWDNSLKASEQVLDLSVFRLVTNFVRLWRLEAGR